LSEIVSSADFGWVELRQKNFFVYEQNFTKFFYSTEEWL